jgi:hypothetical protein
MLVQLIVDGRGDQKDAAVLFRLDIDVEADVFSSCRTRKDADVPLEKPVKRNLLPRFRNDIYADLSAFDQEKADTVLRAAVKAFPCL